MVFGAKTGPERDKQDLQMIRYITGLVGSRLMPSSYKVTSPSKVARSKGPEAVNPMICAVFKMSRTSLNEGGTKRRDDMNLLLSWYLKAAARGRRVKKAPILGTSSFSFDW